MASGSCKTLLTSTSPSTIWRTPTRSGNIISDAFRRLTTSSLMQTPTGSQCFVAGVLPSKPRIESRREGDAGGRSFPELCSQDGPAGEPPLRLERWPSMLRNAASLGGPRPGGLGHAGRAACVARRHVPFADAAALGGRRPGGQGHAGGPPVRSEGMPRLHAINRQRTQSACTKQTAVPRSCSSGRGVRISHQCSAVLRWPAVIASRS